MLLFLDDHLPLGKIANDNSSFSQFASDKARGFMQIVPVCVARAFGHTLVPIREKDVAARLLLAPVPFRADFVQLFVVPAIALEAADVVEASLVVDAGYQGFDAQVKGHNTVFAVFPFFASCVSRSFCSLRN